MTVNEAIKIRRTIRSFKKQPIEPEKLAALLEAARLAPSGWNDQQWKFIVIRNSEALTKLAHACDDQMHVAEAAVAICAVIPNCLGLEPRKREIRLQDIAIANSFMMLQATELGLGTSWIGAFNAWKIRRMLKIPESAEVHSVMVFGYSHYTPPATDRKPTAEIFCSDDFNTPFGS